MVRKGVIASGLARCGTAFVYDGCVGAWGGIGPYSEENK